ncbi:hypothetical protein [Paraburkholderia sp. BL18I3N2]|uniref:hypothetical protein n=1 Tax=Paraburkholderia sp. BL18I3N2 TaxID=1938799 RepID=UPI0015E735AC|nr:hypothetical protein [Paraburkholderia sp. BL18I3N2]
MKRFEFVSLPPGGETPSASPSSVIVGTVIDDIAQSLSSTFSNRGSPSTSPKRSMEQKGIYSGAIRQTRKITGSRQKNSRKMWWLLLQFCTGQHRRHDGSWIRRSKFAGDAYRFLTQVLAVLP